MVRLTDRPDMTLDVYRGRKTTMQQQQQPRQNLLIESYACIYLRSSPGTKFRENVLISLINK